MAATTVSHLPVAVIDGSMVLSNLRVRPSHASRAEYIIQQPCFDDYCHHDELRICGLSPGKPTTPRLTHHLLHLPAGPSGAFSVTTNRTAVGACRQCETIASWQGTCVLSAQRNTLFHLELDYVTCSWNVQVDVVTIGILSVGRQGKDSRAMMLQTGWL